MIGFRRTLSTLFVALVAVAASASLAAQDTLRYQWTKGATRSYRNTTETNMVMSGVPGMGDLNVTNTMVRITNLVANDVAADGTATLKVVFESIKMNMSVPMMGDA